MHFAYMNDLRCTVTEITSMLSIMLAVFMRKTVPFLKDSSILNSQGFLISRMFSQGFLIHVHTYWSCSHVLMQITIKSVQPSCNA